MQRWSLLLLSCLVIVAGACTSGEDVMVRMVLPEGDSASGRQAFLDLQCSACHIVSGAPDMPTAKNAKIGPDLGVTLKGQSRGAIASSVIAPAHVNAQSVELWTELTAEERVWLGPGQVPPRPAQQAKPSRMTDYADVMTVRQLVDIVSFLSSPAKAK